MENGSITLIASTTENPYFYVYNAILSRSTVFEFKAVESGEIEKAVERAFRVLAEEEGRPILPEEGVCAHIASHCGGDVRKAMNAVELSTLACDSGGPHIEDLMSAFQKSMRGSDPDATVHYLGRLLEAGDLPSACRRLLVCACEDVGLAWPQIIPIVKAAVDAALMVGLPEARIPLADAAILVALAPKSNSAYCALDSAIADIKAGKAGPIPRTPPTTGCPSSTCPIPCWAPAITSTARTKTSRASGLTGRKSSIREGAALYDEDRGPT